MVDGLNATPSKGQSQRGSLSMFVELLLHRRSLNQDCGKEMICSNAINFVTAMPGQRGKEIGTVQFSLHL